MRRAEASLLGLSSRDLRAFSRGELVKPGHLIGLAQAVEYLPRTREGGHIESQQHNCALDRCHLCAVRDDLHRVRTYACLLE